MDAKVKELASKSGFQISSVGRSEKPSQATNNDDPSKHYKKVGGRGPPGNQQDKQEKQQRDSRGGKPNKAPRGKSPSGNRGKNDKRQGGLTAEEIATKSGFVLTMPKSTPTKAEPSMANRSENKDRAQDGHVAQESNTSKMNRDDRKEKHHKKRHERTPPKEQRGTDSNKSSGSQISKADGFTVTGLDNPNILPKQEKEGNIKTSEVAGFTITGLDRPGFGPAIKQEKHGQKGSEHEIKNSLFSRIEANADVAGDSSGKKKPSHREIYVVDPSSSSSKIPPKDTSLEKLNNSKGVKAVDGNLEVVGKDGNQRKAVKRTFLKPGVVESSSNSFGGYNKRSHDFGNFNNNDRSKSGGALRGPPATGQSSSFGAPPPPSPGVVVRKLHAVPQQQHEVSKTASNSGRANQGAPPVQDALHSFADTATETDELSANGGREDGDVDRNERAIRDLPKKHATISNDKQDKGGRTAAKKSTITHKIPVPMKTNSRWASDAPKPTPVVNTKTQVIPEVHNSVATKSDSSNKAKEEPPETKPKTYGLAAIVAKSSVEKKVDEAAPPKIEVKKISNWADSDSDED